MADGDEKTIPIELVHVYGGVANAEDTAQLSRLINDHLQQSGRIRVVDDRHAPLPSRCPDCGGPLGRTRVDYARAETARDAGLKIDADVPCCAACRLTLIPSGMVAAARLAAGWKEGRR